VSPRDLWTSRWALSRRTLVKGALAAILAAGSAVVPSGAGERRRSLSGPHPAPAKAAEPVPEPEPEPPDPQPSGPAPTGRRPFPHNTEALRLENSRAGAAAWKITNPANLGEIQAYAGQVSVNAGGSIDFHVSTGRAGTPYRIDVYRMGWYGGAGARLVTSASGLVGQAQGYYTPTRGLVGSAARESEPSTGLLDANWTPSYQLDVPDSWLSGVYLALLADRNGKQTYVPFVVRQDDRPASLLFKASFNTYQAYNAWGGKSLYDYNSRGARTVGGSPAAVRVSFNRPFDSDFGSGEFLRYEYNLVRWLERMGYDVSYIADGDVTANDQRLLQYRGIISAGHDEYWTADERDSVEAARDQGVNVAFLSGNAVYWQARLEPSAAGEAARTLVVHRGRSDPLYQSDPAHATVRWVDPPLNRPQNLLTGTLYAGQTDPFTQDWIVQDTSSWVFEGTGLSPGDRVTKLVGKEFDRSTPDRPGPPGLQILSHSPIRVAAADRPPDIAYAESTLYTAASGAIVFSAGNVTWSWGLDDSAFPLGRQHDTPVSTPIQRMTQNLLDEMTSESSSSPGSPLIVADPNA
jgi:hypothetical protein